MFSLFLSRKDSGYFVLVKSKSAFLDFIPPNSILYSSTFTNAMILQFVNHKQARKESGVINTINFIADC